MRTLQVLLLAALVAFLAAPMWAQTTGTLTLTEENTPPCAPELQLPNFRCATLARNHQGNIVIAGDRIRLDCAGRTVSGGGSGTGIDLTGLFGVIVENCHVTNFGDGIALNGTRRSVFRQNLVDRNTDEGFDLEGSDGNIFLRNTVKENGSDGFDLEDSHENFFEDNEVTQNRVDGIELDFCHNNTFEGNTVSGNGNHGFSLDFSQANIFKRNIANNNRDVGFEIENASNDNTLIANSASGNLGGDAVQTPPAVGIAISVRNWYFENNFRTAVGLEFILGVGD
jgi:parallel beta-helix repeat protein